MRLENDVVMTGGVTATGHHHHHHHQNAPKPTRPEGLSDADDGDWDNCETVFNLDEVDATQPLQPPSRCRIECEPWGTCFCVFG